MARARYGEVFLSEPVRSYGERFTREDGALCETVTETWRDEGQLKTREFVRVITSGGDDMAALLEAEKLLDAGGAGSELSSQTRSMESQRLLVRRNEPLVHREAQPKPEVSSQTSEFIAKKQSIKERLLKLKELRTQGFIEEAEYNLRRNALNDEYKALRAQQSSND